MIKFLLDQDTQKEAWLAAKQTCLSGTEVAAILGLHPYKTAYEVWADKRGIGKEFVPNERAEWGNRHERTLAEKYGEVHNVQLLKGGFLRHKDHDWWGGSLDYYCLQTDRKPIIQEMKTTDLWLADMWGDDDLGELAIPPHYRLQGIWYQPLIDAEATDFAVLIGGNRYREFRAWRNEAILADLMEEGYAWWQKYIINGEDHPVDGSDTARANLAKKFLVATKEVMEASPKQAEMVLRLAEIREQMATDKGAKATLENQLREEIGTGYGIQGNVNGSTFKLTWSGRGGIQKSTAWKSVASDLHKGTRDWDESLKANTTQKPADGKLNPSGDLFKGASEDESAANAA